MTVKFYSTDTLLKLWIWLVALNVIDVASTGMAFKLGFQEANPVLQGQSIEMIAFVKAVIIIVIFLLLVRLSKAAKWPAWSLAAIVAIYTFVVVSNVAAITLLLWG